MLLITLALLLGLFLIGLATWLIFKRRFISAVINGVSGTALLLFVGFIYLLLLNLHTYERLTSEKVIANIRFDHRTEEGIPATISSDGKMVGVFNVSAAEWQLDARFLKLKAWASLLGKLPLVRLETFSDRGLGETDHPIQNHNLVLDETMMSNLVLEAANLLDWIDTYYGSSVYMPAVEGAEYQVTATISGLIARPVNKRADNAVSFWMRQ